MKNRIVKIDAIGCQKKILKQIDNGKGIYIIAVKDNQPNLLDEIEELVVAKREGVREDLETLALELSEKGHGRIDEVGCGIIKLPKDCPLKNFWPTTKAIGYAVRITQDKDGKEEFGARFSSSIVYFRNRLLYRPFASIDRWKPWMP